MTKRSRGVSNTRCKAIVNSTTPRFGPRWPPVWARTSISSSRTSCASCGRSCSRSALISVGERIPSSKRVGAASIWVDSEEVDFVIRLLGFIGYARLRGRLLRWLEIFDYDFAGAVASNDFDLLLRVRESFLTNFYKIHSFFVTHDQIFKRQFARFHLLDNFFEAIHSPLKIRLCLALLRFAAHRQTRN